MKTTIEIQTTRGAFGAAQKIPEREWGLFGTARTVRGFLRVADRAFRATHPQMNAWSGHVRYVHAGRVMSKTAVLRLLGDPETLADDAIDREYAAAYRRAGITRTADDAADWERLRASRR